MTYVAFLRGINVGGNSTISMAVIKQALADLGFSDVRTYLNSGNVIFSTSASDPLALATKIEDAIERRTSLPVKVLVLSNTALKRIVDAIPVTWANDQVMRCDVMLLWRSVDRRNVLRQLPINYEIEDVKYTPGAVIWRVDRKNYGKSRMSRIVGTPLYKQISIRNVNTIRKLNDLIAT